MKTHTWIQTICLLLITVIVSSEAIARRETRSTASKKNERVGAQLKAAEANSEKMRKLYKSFSDPEPLTETRLLKEEVRLLAAKIEILAGQ